MAEIKTKPFDNVCATRVELLLAILENMKLAVLELYLK